jgi:heme exporter protein B
MSAFAAILRKDLRIELRASHSVIGLIVLSALVLTALVIALGTAGPKVELASGAFWLAAVLAGAIEANSALRTEFDSGCIDALRLGPVEPALIFAAKLAASFIFMAAAEIAALVMMVLFYNMDFGVPLLRVIPVMVLGTIGFAALISLLGAVAAQLRAGALLLPVLLVPLFTPALIAGVKATGIVLSGAPLSAAGQWLKVLTAFDVLFVAAGYVLFEFVVKED